MKMKRQKKKEEEGNGIKQLRVREDVSKEEDNLPKNTKIAAKFSDSDTVKGLLQSGMLKGPLKAGIMMECQALWIERMI